MQAETANIQLGHVIRRQPDDANDDEVVTTAVRISSGELLLEPREPADPDVVYKVEQLLKVPKRPIYVFIGSLHPELGTVGLIMSRAWSSRALQGVTCCDSGGLCGKKGGFGGLTTDKEASAAVIALSTPKFCNLDTWEDCFATEIAECHHGTTGYVAGEVPDLTGASVRARCIQFARDKNLEVDRRLWTWELRLNDAPKQKEVVAVVLSHESFKRLENLCESGAIQVTDKVRILHSTSASHWFDNPAIRAALAGES